MGSKYPERTGEHYNLTLAAWRQLLESGARILNQRVHLSTFIVDHEVPVRADYDYHDSTTEFEVEASDFSFRGRREWNYHQSVVLSKIEWPEGVEIERFPALVHPGFMEGAPAIRGETLFVELSFPDGTITWLFAQKCWSDEFYGMPEDEIFQWRELWYELDEHGNVIRGEDGLAFRARMAAEQQRFESESAVWEQAWLAGDNNDTYDEDCEY